MAEAAQFAGSNSSGALPTFKEVEVGEPDSIKCQSCNGDGRMNIAGMKLDCMKCKGKGVESDSRKRLDPGALAVDESSTTLNVCQGADGRLTSLNVDGLQLLVAGVRVNIGVMSGRYLVELRMSALSQQHLVRVGVSTIYSTPLLASHSLDCAFFDSEGFFTHDQKTTKACQPFGGEQTYTLGLLINLESGPGAGSQTLSLFQDGRRASEPHALPEALRGKVLIPTITYKEVSVQWNFFCEAWCPLSFKCRMLPDAVVTDVQQLPSRIADVKSEILFPVGLPETGIFDWIDAFLARNPTYVELSERKLLEWASRSGLKRNKGYAWKTSLDRPGMELGIPSFDDSSAKRALFDAAAKLRRNIVVAELKANLIPEKRMTKLEMFSDAQFVKVGVVLMGEPDEAHKALVQQLILADKRQKAEDRLLQTEVEQAKRKFIMDKIRRRTIGLVGTSVKASPTVAEGTDPVELTEDEKAAWHCPSQIPDLTAESLAAYPRFAIPSEGEGFTEVRYLWQPRSECVNIMHKYLLNKRLNTRLELLRPGVWFTEEWGKWSKALQEWRKLHTAWKDPTKREVIQARRRKKADKKIEDIDPLKLDVASIEDVNDIGNGEPLFANFEYEDWVLLSLRYEMHILCHSFREDCNDPGHPGIPEPHLTFYYRKYFEKLLDIKSCKVATTQELFELMGGQENSVRLSEDGTVLETLLPKDATFDEFLKFIEEMRRDRERIIDAGDEAAKLSFVRKIQVSTAKVPGALATGSLGQKPRLSVPGRPASIGVRPILKTGGIRISNLSRAVVGKRAGVALVRPLGRQLLPRPAPSRAVPGQAQSAATRPPMKAKPSLRPATAQARIATGQAPLRLRQAPAGTRLATAPPRSAAQPINRLRSAAQIRPGPAQPAMRQVRSTLRPGSASAQSARQMPSRGLVASSSAPPSGRRVVSSASASATAPSLSRRVASSTTPNASRPPASRSIVSSTSANARPAVGQWRSGYGAPQSSGYDRPQKRQAPPPYNAPPSQRPRTSYNPPHGSAIGGGGGKGGYPPWRSGSSGPKGAGAYRR